VPTFTGRFKLEMPILLGPVDTSGNQALSLPLIMDKDPLQKFIFILDIDSIENLNI
jgi:hypothetical protein